MSNSGMDSWQRSYRIAAHGVKVELNSLKGQMGIQRMLFRNETLEDDGRQQFPWSEFIRSGAKGDVVDTHFFAVVARKIIYVTASSYFGGGKFGIVGDLNIVSDEDRRRLVSEGYNFNWAKGGGNLNDVPDRLFCIMLMGALHRSFYKMRTKIFNPGMGYEEVDEGEVYFIEDA